MNGVQAILHKAGLKSIGVLLMTLFVLNACGNRAQATGSPQNQAPIKIGISVSLTGDFPADGKATQEGYQLRADNINAHGGLVGRKVTLDFASDASDTNQVSTNYQTFISTNKDDLVLGPYSTLLTKPASKTAARYGYAMVEGSGGGPSVFTQGLNNVFDASPPIAGQLTGFVQYILSLPANAPPATPAYATHDDPFTPPMTYPAE